MSVEATLIDPAPQQSDVAPTKTAAAVQAILVVAFPGAQLVSLVPFNTADAPTIDPRFRIGIDGVAWIARMAVEPAASDGAATMNEVAVGTPLAPFCNSSHSLPRSANRSRAFD